MRLKKMLFWQWKSNRLAFLIFYLIVAVATIALSYGVLYRIVPVFLYGLPFFHGFRLLPGRRILPDEYRGKNHRFYRRTCGCNRFPCGRLKLPSGRASLFCRRCAPCLWRLDDKYGQRSFVLPPPVRHIPVPWLAAHAARAGKSACRIKKHKKEAALPAASFTFYEI